MKKKNLLLLATVLAIVCCIVFFAAIVRNEEQAISIAKRYVSIIYRNDFPGYEINAELERGVWIVWYGLPWIYDENGRKLEGVLGGGGPELRILKINGWVIWCTLQK